VVLDNRVLTKQYGQAFLDRAAEMSGGDCLTLYRSVARFENKFGTRNLKSPVSTLGFSPVDFA